MIDEKKLIEDYMNNYLVKNDGTWNDAMDRAVELAKTAPKVGEWIPVSERLPDELVAVNVTWINRCPQNYYMHIKDKPFTDTAVLYRGEWYWWDNTIIDYLSEYGAYVFETVDKSIDILAWMALPEPWKGGVGMITDYEHMLISALRYALGRRTYIVELTCKYIEKQIPMMSDQCKKIMIEDIEQQEQFGYGDECDKADWMHLLVKLKENTDG